MSYLSTIYGYQWTNPGGEVCKVYNRDIYRDDIGYSMSFNTNKCSDLSLLDDIIRYDYDFDAKLTPTIQNDVVIYKNIFPVSTYNNLSNVNCELTSVMFPGITTDCLDNPEYYKIGRNALGYGMPCQKVAIDKYIKSNKVGIDDIRAKILVNGIDKLVAVGTRSGDPKCRTDIKSIGKVDQTFDRFILTSNDIPNTEIISLNGVIKFMAIIVFIVFVLWLLSLLEKLITGKNTIIRFNKAH